MPVEFDKLVNEIKAKGGADNPFAVARSVLGSNAQIAARRGTGSKSLAGDRKRGIGGKTRKRRD